LVAANQQPADFNIRSEFYEDRKQQKLSKIQKEMDKDLNFRPYILQTKPGTGLLSYCLQHRQEQQYSAIQHSNDSQFKDSLQETSLNKDLMEIRAQELAVQQNSQLMIGSDSLQNLPSYPAQNTPYFTEENNQPANQYGQAQPFEHPEHHRGSLDADQMAALAAQNNHDQSQPWNNEIEEME